MKTISEEKNAVVTSGTSGMARASDSAANETPKAATEIETPSLARRLGLFDATMIVMGGIIGSGIFMNPHVVAMQVHTPWLILGAWLIGGLIALAGAFIYSELAVLRPEVGGQYAYLRDAYHPLVAFLYGWALLLVIQSGGMAAVAITFASYFKQLAGIPISELSIAVVALAVLTGINCLGVRAGTTAQNILMVLKIGAIAALVICGLAVASAATSTPAPVETVTTRGTGVTAPVVSMGAALIPVMFAYGGWQTSSFVSGELRNPRKDLPRGLALGVVGVVILYLLVNLACVRVLGPEGLAQTKTPATAVMMAALGRTGASVIACGIAISTLGFLSQSILTAPRVYYAMAEDKVFFKGVTWLDPRSRVPSVAIILQGALAITIALSGKYEQILNYVVSADFIFFGLTAGCIFVFRRRQRRRLQGEAGRVEPAGAAARTATGPDYSLPRSSGQSLSRVPGHPVTTSLFMAACWLVVISTIYKYPENAGLGLAIILGGIPVFFFWRWWRRNG